MKVLGEGFTKLARTV